jgi:hypothetical protein
LELLSYLSGCVSHKLRDNRTPATLIASGRAWVAKNRKAWSEFQTTTQVNEAMAQAFALAESEVAAQKLWGTNAVYGSIRRARDLALGILSWGRTLDS